MTHKDLNKFKNLSLSREYFYFAAIVSFVIVSSLIWLLWLSYINLKVEKDREYSLEAERIEEALEDSFSYTSNFMEFIGRRIVAYGKYDANSVVFMLQTKAKPGKIRDDLFPWTVFEFVNSDNYAIASTAGVTDTPLKVAR